MPRLDLKHCRACGRHVSECGPLSWSGLCTDDAVARQNANNIQISERRGPFYVHQQRRILLAAHARLLAAEREPG